MKRSIFILLLFSLFSYHCKETKNIENNSYFGISLCNRSLSCDSIKNLTYQNNKKLKYYDIIGVYQKVFFDNSINIDSIRLFLKKCDVLGEKTKIKKIKLIEYINNIHVKMKDKNIIIKRINLELNENTTFVIYYSNDFEELIFIVFDGDNNCFYYFIKKSESNIINNVLCTLINDSNFVTNKILYPNIKEKIKFTAPNE